MLLWYLPKEVENLCLPKNLDMNVYSSFICNCQDLEANQDALQLLNKLWLIQRIEYYSALQSNEKMWRKLKCIFLRERRHTEGFQIQDILEVAGVGGGGVIDNKTITVGEDLGGKMDEQVEHRGFLGQ